MKKVSYIILVLFLIPTLILWSLYCCYFGYEKATELAIKDKVILFNGKIYSVKDTGDKY